MDESLKDDGCLILSTPNLAELINRIKLFLGTLSLPINHHIRHFTKASMKELLKTCGFRITKHKGFCVYLPPRRFLMKVGLLEPISRVLEKLIPDCSHLLIFKCKKEVKRFN